jgi:transcriptional regulator with PAS, ATPase and Fis domain
MADIVFVAPSLQLTHLAMQLREQAEDINVITGRLEAGVAMAREAVENGARVLISRGFTYQMIVDALPHIPVIEVKFSGYDILRVYPEARSIGRPIAVVESTDVIEGFARIEEILEVNEQSIRYAVSHYSEYARGIEVVAEMGAGCVIGNIAVAQKASSLGLTGIVIESGSEAICQAFSSARQVMAVQRIRDAHARQIDTIINAVDYGILAIDSAGEITASNTAAKRIINLAGDDSSSARTHIITKMKRCLDNGVGQIGTVEKLGGGNEVVVSYHQILSGGEIIGIVATMQELQHLRAVEQRAREELTDRGRVARHSFIEIESQSPGMHKVIEDAKRFAGFDATILILGETGVGKEYFAHAIHQASLRKKGPFVAVNCAAIPENLLESELFGYAEGAFTGAKKGGKIGLFEQAHGGTIFLDEIGEMSEHLQARLLRVLQEHEIYRLGDDRVMPIDIRIIAATNRDLWKMVAEKKFREDLYYRLDVLTIRIPPLRERKADIEIFVRGFVREFNTKYRTSVKGIDAGGMDLLKYYDWPGNIRELQNVVGRLIALASSPIITEGDVRNSLRNVGFIADNRSGEGLKAIEEAAIREALARTGGNKQQAAELLGIGRATLWRKIKQLHI